MKKGFVFSLMAVLALAGCQTKELDYAPQQESKHFTATIEDGFDGGDTRTYMDENGNVRWKQGDQVSIFAGSTVNEQHQVTDASDGKTAAEFNKVGGSGFVGGTDIDNNVAFYPYASTAEIAKSGSAYVISDITLPATQNYAVASFGNGAFPMAAVTSDTDDMHLKFKNVLGGLKLQLKGTASIASISVTGNRNEVLCGAASVTVSNGNAPSINLTDATAKTVTLDCGDGVQLNAETATAFVIALPPMTMEGGFSVLVTDTNGGTMEIKTTKTQTINRSSLLKMPAVTYEESDIEPDYLNEPLTITSVGSTSVGIYKYGSPADIVLEYKKGDGNWIAYTIGSYVDLLDGETLQFRAGSDGNSSFSTDYNNRYKFSINGNGSLIVSGNIMSLLDRSLERVSLNEGAFYSLFSYCNVVDAANLKLPATSLAKFCYNGLLSGNALTTAPELPATTLAYGCYQSMFNGCRSLTSAPELPATTMVENCYAGMFNGCTSLSTAPALPAMSLATFCYAQMFQYCKSLINAPVLPATTMAVQCYKDMFYGCTSLATAPELPAMSLSERCYDQMFYGCNNLTLAPVLPATTLVSRCYESMFSSCTKLNYIKALFTTTPSSSYTNNWVSGVAATGTFVKSSSATWDVTGNNGVPTGWTVSTDIPTPEAVDLGLPSGLKWASFNLGASNPEEYGDYYAWGETEPYYNCLDPLTWKEGKEDGYDWLSYKWGMDGYNSLTKYCNRTSYGYNGFTDNKTVLDPEDDAAHVNLGGNWRMPTDTDWAELLDNCTWTWTTQGGVYGRLVTASNGNSIFLPAAGQGVDTYLYEAGSFGYYWSSSLDTGGPSSAWRVYFDSGNIYRFYNSRYLGHSVRPVTE